MEKYNVQDQLGKGAQGVVYLSTHTDTGIKWALKKIECNDESEANKAYKEMVALEKLKHPYLCSYKEFFVSWDKDLSAMFVTVVSDYFAQGDLSHVLTKHRDENKPVDEELIKKWLGQMTDAMMFVHKKKVIHRDLKPSNVFVTEDNSVSIGDFGVPTVMRDIRTKTRASVGSMNWMAPEVLTRAYDERSDVWSMGCILLELASTAFCDTATMSGKLFEIKHNPEALEELLTSVREHHSPELVELIGKMLNRSYTERPDTNELSEIAYVRECLVLSNCVLAERKQKAQSPVGGRSLPRDKGATAVVDFMLDTLGNENCVKESLTYLSELTKEENLQDVGKKVVVKCLKDYISEPEIQCLGLAVLENLVVFADASDILYSKELIAGIPESMKTHVETSAAVQQAAASFLGSLAANDAACQFIGDVGGMQDILEAMRHHSDNACGVLTACCNAMWALTVNEDNVRIVTEHGGIVDVITALKTHLDDPQLVEAACAALLSLSMEDENLGSINRMDTVASILQALCQHVRDARVVKHACMALAAMVEPDEESAFKLLTNLEEGEKEVMGLPIVTRAYEQHKDNAEVVQAISTLLMELADYDEICAEMKHLRMGETVLTEIHKRFKENKNIMKPCESALMRTGGGKIHLRPPSVKAKQRN